MRRRRPSLDPNQVFRSVRTRKRRARIWHPHRWWSWTLLAVVLVAGGGAGWGAWYYYRIQGDIQQQVGGVQPSKSDAEPFNVLIVGSDSRKGLSEREQLELGANPVEGERADTLILAHIDPRSNRVTLVQFPRDLYVPIAGGEPNKINSALEHGNTTLVRTVQDFTGLEVNSYVKVNIAGFKELVDAIDGVEVCISEPIPFDTHTGIEITPDEVGMVKFDGERALRFVRTRALPGGDFDRIRNQQKFLAAAVDKVLSVGTFLNLARIEEVIDVARGNLRIDKHTSLPELLGIARRFESFEPDRYEAYTAPNRGIGENEAGSVVLPDDEALAALFAALKRNESPASASEVPPVDPDEIAVGVYNGTAKPGAARRAADGIVAATTTSEGRIVVEEVANARRFGYRNTVVIHRAGDPDAAVKAEFVAAALPGATLRGGETEPDVDVAVIVGRRFDTDRVIQIEPIPLPEPGRLPRVCR